MERSLPGRASWGFARMSEFCTPLLGEEKRTDEKLSRLAELNVNRDAADSPSNAWRPEAVGEMSSYQAPMRLLAYVVHGSRSKAGQ